LESSEGLGFSKHVDGNPSFDMSTCADAINGLLHLPMTPVAAFHGVGSRRQQFVVQEGERLFQVGREKLAEGFADRPGGAKVSGTISKGTK